MPAKVNRGALRRSRQRFRGVTEFGWKGAVVWSCILAIGGFFVLNWIYQVIRKPGEIFAPVSASLSKSPESTWQSYGSLFEKHSTSIISPEFLAALAQVEGDGNPIARTYWRWQWSWNPLEIYRPASSALGMFQITDATFAEARKYCIRDHKVMTEGLWYDPRSCWFNSFYTRILPSHSTEMTAAYLHQSVVNTLAARRIPTVTLAQRQKLAAVIHLCGVKRGEILVRRGFGVAPGEQCGTHNLSRYLIQVDLMKQRFARLRRGTELSEPVRKLSSWPPTNREGSPERCSAPQGGDRRSDSDRDRDRPSPYLCPCPCLLLATSSSAALRLRWLYSRMRCDCHCREASEPHPAAPLPWSRWPWSAWR